MATVVDLGTWQADRSYLWSVFTREMAVAAIALHDDALCAQLFSDIEPLAGSCGVNGAVVAFAGSHAHTAGLLAKALGREGRALLRTSRDTYRHLGAAGWLAEVDRELSIAGDIPSGRSLRRQGRMWQISFNGRQAWLPHSKGLADLAVLLARPGQDVHVLDLCGSADRTGPGGEMADRTALAAYRRRLGELDDEAAEAATNHDGERQALLEREKEELLDQLRQVIRPDGRPRSFAAYPAERARKAVAARLRDTIRKLEPELPDLATHLDQTIVTGSFCRYRADRSDRWQIHTEA